MMLCSIDLFTGTGKRRSRTETTDLKPTKNRLSLLPAPQDFNGIVAALRINQGSVEFPRGIGQIQQGGTKCDSPADLFLRSKSHIAHCHFSDEFKVELLPAKYTRIM